MLITQGKPCTIKTVKEIKQMEVRTNEIEQKILWKGSTSDS